jgi:hypothetical protein
VDDALGYHSPLFALECFFLSGLCLSFCHNPRACRVTRDA